MRGGSARLHGSDQVEVFQAGCRIDQLIGWHLDGNRHAVGIGADINAAVVHQSAFDFVEDCGDAASVEMIGQLTDGNPDGAGFQVVLLPVLAFAEGAVSDRASEGWRNAQGRRRGPS